MNNFCNPLLLSIMLTSLSLSSCSAKAPVEAQFLEEFTEDIHDRVISMCQEYSSSQAEEGVYYSKYAFGLYTFVGLKDHKFEVLKFDDSKFPQRNITRLYTQKGDYQKQKNTIILETKEVQNFDAPHVVVPDFEKFTLLVSPKNSFLLTDLEDFSFTFNWLQKIGPENKNFKKIQCTANDLKQYKRDEEISPSYDQLPSELKAVVLKSPQHFTIEKVQDIRQDIAELVEPEDSVQQYVWFSIRNPQGLYFNQPVCLMTGKAKGQIGYMSVPKMPTSAAWFFYEKDSISEQTKYPEKGDILTTSANECPKL